MTEQQSSPPVATTPARSSLRLLIPTMVALSGVAAFVYLTQPKPAVYVPGPDDVQKVKSAAEVQKNIETVKASENIPPGEKGRILGFLNMELQQAKAREKGEPVPPMQANPPAVPKPQAPK